MSNGLATYHIPLARSLQEIFKGACCTCVFLTFTCKNKDHPSFLQVTLLADITDGRGTHIIPNIFLRVKKHTNLLSHQWPRQAPPSATDWHIWHTALKNSLTANDTGQLTFPLGI